VLNKIFKKIHVINFVGILLLAIFYIFNYLFYSEKIVFVDNAKLFDGFNMTIELKKNGEKEFNIRKKNLDSLYSKLQSANISESDKKRLIPIFTKGKEEIEQFNQIYGTEQNSKIVSRINDYMEIYAKDKGIEMIISSQNKQSIIYASDKVDKTKEILSFINKKYEGIK
jgi:outer membrane protein